MTKNQPKERQTCVVISPIWSPEPPDTPLDTMSGNWLLDHIVKPVAAGEPWNYDVLPVDQSSTGLIDEQIINSIHDANLIIADLSGGNANAFYELGLAHAFQRPVIHMISLDDRSPFDISHHQFIDFDRHTANGVEEARLDLVKQIEAVNLKDFQISNPVTRARGIQKISVTGDSRFQIISQVLDDQRETKKLIVDLVRKLDSLEQNDISQDANGFLRTTEFENGPPTLKFQRQSGKDMISRLIRFNRKFSNSTSDKEPTEEL